MAGLGRKVFASGDILLASEVQGFLQDQAVMVFDDDAARTAAIATPTEGMVTFRKDDNALEVFDGSTFVAVGGGSSGGSLVHINSTSFSGVVTQSFNDVFSATFENYFMQLVINSSTTSLKSIRFRASGTDATASNYQEVLNEFANTLTSVVNTASATLAQISPTDNAGLFYNIHVLKPSLAENSVLIGDALRVGRFRLALSSRLGDSTVYDGFTLRTSSGTMNGKVDIYGIRQS